MNMVNLRIGSSPVRPGASQQNDVLPRLRQKFRIFKNRIEFNKPSTASTSNTKNQRTSAPSKKLVLSRNSVRIHKEAAAHSFSTKGMRSESSNSRVQQCSTVSASPISLQLASGGKVVTSGQNKASLQSAKKSSEAERLVMALRRSNSQELRRIKNEEQLVNSSKVQRNNSLFIKKRKASNLLDKETVESLKHVFEPKLVKLCFKGLTED